MSQRQACLLYTRASCNRRNECLGGTAQEHLCPETEAKCPDLLFSEGSLRTVDGLIACAEAVAHADCLDAGVPVIPPGLMVGEPCTDQPCSAGNACLEDPANTSPGSPGKCTPIPKTGETCGRERGATDDVPYGHVCSDDTYCEASGASLGACEAGTSCVSGTCTSMGLQGLFKAACGG